MRRATAAGVGPRRVRTRARLTRGDVLFWIRASVYAASASARGGGAPREKDMMKSAQAANNRLSGVSVVRIARRRPRRQMLYVRSIESRTVGIRADAAAARERSRLRAAGHRRLDDALRVDAVVDPLDDREGRHRRRRRLLVSCSEPIRAAALRHEWFGAC